MKLVRVWSVRFGRTELFIEGPLWEWLVAGLLAAGLLDWWLW